MAVSKYYSYPTQPEPTQSHSRGWLFLVILVLVGGVAWWSWPQAKAALIQPIQAPAFVPINEETRLQKVLNNYSSIDASVELMDTSTGLTASLNATKSFTAASTTKLITACYYLHLVEQGQHTLTELVGLYPAQTQLQQMINQSNNDSWSALHDVVGRDNEQAYAQSIGLTSFNQANNTINAADLAHLLQQLWLGNLLNHDDTQLLLSWMQNTNDEDLIPPGLPTGAVVYHKYGELDDIVHDEALVIWKGRTYVWVVMTDGNGDQDYDTRQKMFLDLTQTVFANLGPAKQT